MTQYYRVILNSEVEKKKNINVTFSKEEYVVLECIHRSVLHKDYLKKEPLIFDNISILDSLGKERYLLIQQKQSTQSHGLRDSRNKTRISQKSQERGLSQEDTMTLMRSIALAEDKSIETPQVPDSEINPAMGKTIPPPPIHDIRPKKHQLIDDRINTYSTAMLNIQHIIAVLIDKKEIEQVV